MDMRIGFNLDVNHHEGAIRTDGFPLLAYSPAQWGHDQVCTENNGTSVAAIVQASAEESDYAKLAERFGITSDHVRQALAYAMINGG